jgi:hypothetical protein
MKVDEILQLMAGMSQHRIGMLEVGGLKLVSAPPERSATAAASGINVPGGSRSAVSAPSEEKPPTQADAEAAARAVEVARTVARENALSQMQQRTAAARRKAVGGIGEPSIGKMVDDLVKEANKPRSARKPNA